MNYSLSSRIFFSSRRFVNVYPQNMPTTRWRLNLSERTTSQQQSSFPQLLDAFEWSVLAAIRQNIQRDRHKLPLIQPELCIAPCIHNHTVLILPPQNPESLSRDEGKVYPYWDCFDFSTLNWEQAERNRDPTAFVQHKLIQQNMFHNRRCKCSVMCSCIANKCNIQSYGCVK